MCVCVHYIILLLYIMKSSYWLILVLIFRHVTKWSTPIIGWCYNSIEMNQLGFRDVQVGGGVTPPPPPNKKAWTSLIGLREHHNYYQHTVIRMCSWKKCDLKLRMTEMCDIFLFSMLILFLHCCAAYLQGDRRLTH